MGLVAAAYFLERTEAVVARSALDDAGFLAIIGNEDMLTMQPYYTMAFGGYRVLVSELDLEDALAVLRGAVAPAETSERLVVRGDLLDYVLSLVIGMLAGGAPAPLRERLWQASD